MNVQQQPQSFGRGKDEKRLQQHGTESQSEWYCLEFIGL